MGLRVSVGFFIVHRESLSFSLTSPGDSTGATPDESKRLYDEALAKNPNSILSVHHETKSKTRLFFMEQVCVEIPFPDTTLYVP